MTTASGPPISGSTPAKNWSKRCWKPPNSSGIHPASAARWFARHSRSPTDPRSYRNGGDGFGFCRSWALPGEWRRRRPIRQSLPGGLSVEALAIDTLAIRPHQPQISRHDLLRCPQRFGVLAWIGIGTHLGACGAWVKAVDPQGTEMLHLFGKHFDKTFGGKLRNRVPTPEGTPFPAHTGRGENHRSIRRCLQQRQQRLGHPDRTIDIDLHYLGPQFRIVLLERSDFPQQAGIVQNPVETPELLV